MPKAVSLAMPRRTLPVRMVKYEIPKLDQTWAACTSPLLGLRVERENGIGIKFILG